MFKLFSCPVFLFFTIAIGNFLIFGQVYKYIGWQVMILLGLVLYWILSSDKKFKLKMILSKD